MVSLINRMLVDLMEDMAGREKVLEVKRRAGIDDGNVFRLNEAYDDEWQRLFSATCAALRVTQDQAEEAFADFRISRHPRGPTPMPFDL